MLPYRNKPILEHIILNAKKQGIKNFIISINYLGKQIKKHFGNGSKLNVKIEYIEDQCIPIIRHYKNFYNRPRPYQVAAFYNKELRRFK